MDFPDCELVVEHAEMLCGKHPLRIYRSRCRPLDPDKPIESYFYHFGFPRYFVQPIRTLLETTPFWGDEHWGEDGEFWLWYAHCVGGADKPPPWKAIQAQLDFDIRQYNRCLRTCRKFAAAK